MIRDSVPDFEDLTATTAQTILRSFDRLLGNGNTLDHPGFDPLAELETLCPNLSEEQLVAASTFFRDHIIRFAFDSVGVKVIEQASDIEQTLYLQILDSNDYETVRDFLENIAPGFQDVPALLWTKMRYAAVVALITEYEKQFVGTGPDETEVLETAAEAFLTAGFAEEAERAAADLADCGASELARDVFEVLGIAERAAECSYQLGEVALYESDFTVAVAEFARARDSYLGANRPAESADCTYRLARALMDANKLEDAELELIDAMAAFVDTEQPEGFTLCLNYLGIIYYRTGRYDEAEETLLRVRNDLGNDLSRADCEHTLGCIYRRTARYRQAEESFEHALDLYQRHGRESSIPDTLLEVGIVYTRTGRYDDAERVFDQARDLHYGRMLDLGIDPNIADCDHHLAIVYTETGRYDQAESAFEHARDVYQRLRLDIKIAEHHREIASLYLHTDRTDNAKKSYVQAWETYDALGMDEEAADCIRRLGLVYQPPKP
ncbi:tetratricopeptide repeat protein [Rhodococcus sp. NCIMB 12038]|uniref:tetratricopeptide repeat protein n=1 Tax=Rhodococcus sp. NCIMB 12038 TaxID=933800 RepID=UPI000B3CB069|nr:tetratricopeptide repeat protein [Rhodococcus sp. NCIMB 12038]OUS97308.1 hypothetical protein CA951_02885 [Rhodococcus sp. NCIMB 12038]